MCSGTSGREVLNSGWSYRDIVPREAGGHTALQYYAGRYPHSSVAVWEQRLRAGQISKDGVLIGPHYMLSGGEELIYQRPPWHEMAVPVEYAVLHQDTDLVAVAKPAGLPTLPGGGFLENTLLFLVRRDHGTGLSPVHRLGRGTSGIVVFARSTRARRQLSAALRTGRMRKEYRALVDDARIASEQTIEVPIGTVPYGPLGRLHVALAKGKPARSHVRVLERRTCRDQALVAVEIPTGRTHQIRIHLAAVGHPLSGDPLYVTGGGARETAAGEARPLPGQGGYHLHARQVDLIHPANGEPLTITCVPPSILRCAGEEE